MALILNLIAFVLCITWFHRLIKQPGNKLLFPVLMVYLGSSMMSFILAFVIQHDFLDILGHAIVTGIAVLVFWLWTSIVVIIKHVKTGDIRLLFTDLAQTTLPLLIIILFILSFNDGGSLKIGG
ncbi:hypothetical protein [uncultured Fluviicola sp.]|uniref:hypothetical protein n=1 Tax=uncultured Fluviicola sp. TaxID=463303 RepID=UPI0025D76402|nr:hypothetical protein [uncultured Fluviicola sp.]